MGVGGWVGDVHRHVYVCGCIMHYTCVKAIATTWHVSLYFCFRDPKDDVA